MANNKPKTYKKKSVKKKGRKKKKSANPLMRMPKYMLIGLLSAVVVIYVVFFYRTFVGPYSFRWKALFGEVTYPKGSVRGIDISHHQGEIDWDKLRKAEIQGSPVRFVFVKATEGTSILDENFNQNFFNAKKYGFLRAAYHFYSTTSSAKAQAKYFCKMVHLEEGDLPPILDIEPTPEQISSIGGKAALQRNLLEWLNIVEKNYGAKPIIYASYKFRTGYLDSEEFDAYPYWIAHYYVPELSYTGKWKFWQHTDAGRVDGIREYVDINLFNGEMKDLEDLVVEQEN